MQLVNKPRAELKYEKKSVDIIRSAMNPLTQHEYDMTQASSGLAHKHAFENWSRLFWTSVLEAEPPHGKGHTSYALTPQGVRVGPGSVRPPKI